MSLFAPSLKGTSDPPPRDEKPDDKNNLGNISHETTHDVSRRAYFKLFFPESYISQDYRYSTPPPHKYRFDCLSRTVDIRCGENFRGKETLAEIY